MINYYMTRDINVRLSKEGWRQLLVLELISDNLAMISNLEVFPPIKDLTMEASTLKVSTIDPLPQLLGTKA